MDRNRLLAIFAHPDDEAFGCAGTFARLTDRGGSVTLVCATRGEAGAIREGAVATRETLGAVREVELRAAMAIVGVSDIRLLDYRDSGMEGTDDNHDPRAFMGQSEPEVTARLAAVIRAVQPAVLITFGPDGIYGHPDHVMAHRTATAAYRAASAEQPDTAPALYFTAVSRERIPRMAERQDGPFRTMSRERLLSMGYPDAEISTRIDVSGQFERKLAAIRAHRTQVAPDGPYDGFSEQERRTWLSTERFRLARVPGWASGIDPLFELVTAEPAMVGGNG